MSGPTAAPGGGGGFIHLSMEDYAHYRASIYEETHHAWDLSNDHSPKPDMHEGSTRVSLTEGKGKFDLPDQHRCVPAHAASKIMMYENLLGADK